MRICRSLRDAFAIAIGLCCLSALAIQPARAQKSPRDMPVYKVDPFWPKPLPHKWILEAIPVMVTDKDDHIWVISRPGDVKPDENGAATTPPRTDCCIAAPAVMEFDTEGNVLQGWGGPGYTPGWPKPQEHAILVDREGNVWLSSGGRGNSIQKFTGDGKFLWDFGHRAPPLASGEKAKENNQQTDILQGGVFNSLWTKTSRKSTSSSKNVCWYTATTDPSSGGGAERARRSPTSAMTPPRLMIGSQARLPIRRSSRPHSIAFTSRPTASFTSANAAATGFRCSPSRANS